MVLFKSTFLNLQCDRYLFLLFSERAVFSSEHTEHFETVMSNRGFVPSAIATNLGKLTP